MDAFKLTYQEVYC